MRIRAITLVGCVGLLGGSAAGVATSSGASATGATETFTSTQIGPSGQTPQFGESSNWKMAWTYNCANFGSDGAFAVSINGMSNRDVGPNEYGTAGSGTDHYTDTGTFTLTISQTVPLSPTSDCDWSITVSPDTTPVSSSVATFTSDQVGTSGQTARFQESGPWQLDWTLSTASSPNPLVGCLDTLVPMAFQATINGSKVDIGPYGGGREGLGDPSGVSYYPDTGTFSLTVTSTGQLGAAGCPWTIAVRPLFSLLSGHARDIAAGADGAIWMVGTNRTPGGYGIYTWTGRTWTEVPGGAVTIAVAPDGSPWVINSSHRIYHRVGRTWDLLPGAATDIAIGAYGAVWVIGATPTSGGYGIYTWTGRTWSKAPGGAVTIAVDADGNPWVINSSHRVYAPAVEITFQVGSTWSLLPGAATDVAAGPYGAVWVIGTNAVEGGYGIYTWTGTWTSIPGGAVTITVLPNGHPLVLNSSEAIYST